MFCTFTLALSVLLFINIIIIIIIKPTYKHKTGTVLNADCVSHNTTIYT